MVHLLADLTGPHALMMVAHLLAAAGVAGWLWVGENALWTVLCLLGRAAAGVARAVAAALAARPQPVPVLPSRRPVVRAHQRPPRPAVPPPLLGALTRRGPPALVVTF